MYRRVFALVALVLTLLATTSSQAADKEVGFRSLFDGKTLDGWTGNTEFWRVEDGAIVGESTAEKPLDHNTFLIWDRGEIDDFELRLEFRLTSENDDAANSGVQFRSQVAPDGHVVG